MLGKLINYLPVAFQKVVFKSVFFLLSLIFHHRKNVQKKDIFVFSTRRGGSTLLGQIISANNGIRNIDQPLTSYSPQGVAGILRSNIVASYLSKKKYSQYTSVSPDDQEQILEYMRLLAVGKLSLNTWLEYKASRKKLLFYTDRVMLKFTDANAIINWFASSFDDHIVYLVRHPIANALSVMKNKWTITASAYLDDKSFCEKYITDDQQSFGRNILKTDDYFQQAILNWCLENIVPLNFSEDKFFTLTYEELVICPEEIINLLSTQLGLNDKSQMLKVSKTPSYSMSLSENRTVEDIMNANSAADIYKNVINRWREKISDEQLQIAMELLQKFNISIYTCDSSIPSDKYLHFSSCFNERVTGLTHS